MVAEVRIGVLGAARITPAALILPARQTPRVRVVAVAARDPHRAAAFAHRHGIPRVHPSYEALLADPEVDAIYNPLPNNLHCLWTIRALEAGKHVLCEKPFAANEQEACQMAAAAQVAGKVVMEALHYRYHPLADRMLRVVRSGVLGQIRHIETAFCVPLPFPRDIRYRYHLAGGATMDLGSYTIHLIRLLADAEPEVTTARARLAAPQLDRWMTADFRFADSRTARMTCALLSRALLRISVQVRGDAGELTVINPFQPARFHRLTLRTATGLHVEQSSRVPTYVYQLRAFAASVLDGAPVLTPPADSVATMRVIDRVYQVAGLQPRGMPSL